MIPKKKWQQYPDKDQNKNNYVTKRLKKLKITLIKTVSASHISEETLIRLTLQF